MSQVNVRVHRAGRAGYDTGIVSIPTAEGDVVLGDVYVSTIYIANLAATPTMVTLKSGGTIFYQRQLIAGEHDEIQFLEPARFSGIRAVASQSGAIIIVVGYK